MFRYSSFKIIEFVRLQNSRFFLKISKEIGKAWRTSLTRAKLASFTRRACEAREKKRIFRKKSPYF